MSADRLPAGQMPQPVRPFAHGTVGSGYEPGGMWGEAHYEPDKRRLVALYGYGLPFSNLTFKTSMPMNKTVWNTLLNVIIAVASAILGAIGGSAM